MAGVMEAFAPHVDPRSAPTSILAGPAVTGVADDPEAAEVYDDCIDAGARCHTRREAASTSPARRWPTPTRLPRS